MKLFRRENYLKQVRGFYHDTELIKVITGVRRCGKSCLMHTIAEELIEQGISESNIAFIDLKKRNYTKIHKPEELEDLIESSFHSEGTKYLFIDEVQNVKGFENVIEAFRLEEDYSIFITGSNSYLLSGELSTVLTGRYLSFEMFTLTFEEYEQMKKFYGKDINPNLTVEMDRYILEGGFPKALDFDSIDEKRTYVENVIKEIYNRDIRQKVKIRNRVVFENIQRYIINNFGSPTSISNMLSDLKKNNMEIKRETLGRYIQILLDAKILYECKRFDLKSRKSMQGESKYYLADLSFYYMTNTDNRVNYGPVLENIIFQYARSKRYEVSIGKIGKFECDFILRKNMDYSYVQISKTIMESSDTEDREYRPLESIKDNYPKYVLTLNDLTQRRSGIIHRNIPEFTAEGNVF